MTDPRYPIGRFEAPTNVSAADRAAWISAIERLPAELHAAVEGLSEAQIDTPYRDGGWTVRQLVHHVPDSHANAYVRFKLALTEDAPTIKPYEEARWAELPDSSGPIASSLALLDGLHARWTALLRALPEAAFARGYTHPEQRRVIGLDEALAMYAWHGRHHAAHVTALREREGW